MKIETNMFNSIDVGALLLCYRQGIRLCQKSVSWAFDFASNGTRSKKILTPSWTRNHDFGSSTQSPSIHCTLRINH
jgi:hypothetical protein